MRTPVFRRFLAACVVIGALTAACTIPPTDVPSPLDGIASWSQVTGSGPPARWGHVAVFDRARRRVIVWGGTNLSVTFNDLWAFSLDSQTWQSLSASGGPAGRVTSAAVADEARDRMVIMGGSGGGSASDEVWALQLATLTWQKLSSGPPARFDAGAATDGEKAWLFGGYSASNQALDDLWELDLATGSWEQLPTPTGRPAPRTNVGFGRIGARLLLTGGHDEDGLNSDSWSYDLVGRRWEKLVEANTPRARAHYAFATDPTCGLVWLLGGDLNDYVSDSFELWLPSRNRKQPSFRSVRSVRSRGGTRRSRSIPTDAGSCCSAAGRGCPRCWATPGSQLRLRARALLQIEAREGHRQVDDDGPWRDEDHHLPPIGMPDAVDPGLGGPAGEACGVDANELIALRRRRLGD